MTDRVDVLMQAVDSLDVPAGEPITVRTSVGPVSMLDIREGAEGDRRWVEVDAVDPEGGDPSFRIFGPPALVPDPAGDVEINGERYRHDPVAALAEVIGQNGGRRRTL